jgi:hypothetical protein
MMPSWTIGQRILASFSTVIPAIAVMSAVVCLELNRNASRAKLAAA